MLDKSIGRLSVKGTEIEKHYEMYFKYSSESSFYHYLIILIAIVIQLF
jgi:hypothetical protein